jgi:DNA-binding GntR family transcriptional regulator
MKVSHLSLSNKTYNQLKKMIAVQELKPGSRILYKDLVELLGVSLTPIKESILKLEQEGLVEIIPRRGVYIIEESKKDIYEIFELRELLEGFAVEKACEYITAEDIQQLETKCEDLKTAMEKKDIDACKKADLEFHSLIINCCRNTKLQKIMNNTRYHQYWVSIQNPNYSDKEDSYTWLLKTYKAIVDRDSDKAVKYMKNHIRSSRDSLFLTNS